jgi:hypothetical protein
MRGIPFCRALAACVALAALVGCAQQRAWSYRASPAVRTAPLLAKTVAVPPLADGRENVNLIRRGLGFIPLLPYGWDDMQSPEGVQMHATSGIWFFKPSEDMAKAIAEELQNSGIFKQAFFTYRDTDGDLVLRGRIQSTRYQDKMYTYCLSFFGVYLWFFGAPAVSCENELGLTLTLEDPAAKRVLWERSFTKSRGTTSWIYSQEPDFFYDALLKEIMDEAIPSLKQSLAHGA